MSNHMHDDAQGAQEPNPSFHKASYNKGLEDADQMVGALWSDLFNKDLVKAAGADFFDKWRGRIRELKTAAPAPHCSAASEPVAYRVKDFADGWILCHTREVAEHEADGQCLIEPLYNAQPQGAPK